MTRAAGATLAMLVQAACRRSTSQRSSNAGAPLSVPTNDPKDLSASTASTPLDPRAHLRVVELTIPGGDWEKRATLLVPNPPSEAALPVLVALHGMGETVDPETGAHGWLDAYELDVAIARLCAPPLDEDAFRGFVTPDRLQAVNASLAQHPYRGVIVCCPYLPRAIGGDVSFDAYARFLADELLPRVRASTPARSELSATGIDGVSLGGVTALTLGVMRPDVFGAVGALQAAISADQVDRVADDLAHRIGKRPLRITTSEDDVYHDVLVALDRALVARGVAHEFAVEPGPHDYIWNKGPGAIDMLLWHDRVLRGG